MEVANPLALAAAAPNEIPSRYLRHEAIHISSGDGDLEIPIIDMKKLLDPESSTHESAKLHLACRDWGFFQLMNHNISIEVIERMKANITEFFKLPVEKKMEFSQSSVDRDGYAHMSLKSDGQKVDWSDMLLLKTQPTTRRSINAWPTQPLTMRDAIDNYSSELYLVAHSLLGFIAKNLGVNPESITNTFKDGTQSMRINYYPPCLQADKVLGIPPHSDPSILTLVLQANEVQGLQIKKNGGWIPVNPVLGAFVVNIGDTLEILSNGIYKSIEHRVVINKEKERLSVAGFHDASPASMIGPFPEIVGNGEANYKTLYIEDFLKLFFSSKLDSKSLIDGMKLNR